ncbi:MAG TPA: hypothetical protein VG324_16275, partial [Blastocatellia bacterium]|nr:hypothetical protein [Blastocatellia bacterium]
PGDGRAGGGGGVYGVAGLGVTLSFVNDGGGGGATCVMNSAGGAYGCRGDGASAGVNFVPHSSQYSEPSRLLVPQ